MNPTIETFLLSADAKALATISVQGIVNVVPVSTMTIRDGKIILINYFLEKTLENILANNHVALVGWSKMIGFQIKGTAEYKTDGKLYDEMVVWIKEILPDRLVKGIIVITPTEIFDIAPGKDSEQQL